MKKTKTPKLPRTHQPAPPRARADELLTERGFAASQSQAGALILAGKVLLTDAKGHERKLKTAGERLPPGVQFRLKGETRPFVSRAGSKLLAALEGFNLEVQNRVCLDLGLSTGGFSDCLLQRGARRVHGVDVAYGIVDWRLRKDARLILHERTNVRHLTLETLGEKVSFVTIDLSFIGLSAVWKVLPPLLEPDAHVIALVKPQFELKRNEVEDGVITCPATRQKALESAGEDARQAGLITKNYCPSPVLGRSGNQEWLLHLTLA